MNAAADRASAIARIEKLAEQLRTAEQRAKGAAAERCLEGPAASPFVAGWLAGLAKDAALELVKIAAALQVSTPPPTSPRKTRRR